MKMTKSNKYLVVFFNKFIIITLIGMFLCSCKINDYSKSIKGTWHIMYMEIESVQKNSKVDSYLLFSPRYKKVSIRIDGLDFTGDFILKDSIITISNCKKKEFNNSYTIKLDTIVNNFEMYRFRIGLLSERVNIIGDKIVIKYFGKS